MNESISSLRPDEQQRKPTILLVEDHFITRWSAAEYLRRVGFKVIEAVDVTEAMGVINSGVTVDAVLSDVHMPGDEDGYALARWLAKHRPNVPVVLTSSAPRDPEAPKDGSLRRFVPKPYELSNLEQLLRQMLSQGV